MKKKILKLFVYSFLMFIGFSNIVDAKNVTVDELVTAIGKSKVAVVETAPFDPDKVYIITSCTFSAKKTTNGFSYSPSCIMQNAPQPSGEVEVNYNKDNNTISFEFPEVGFVGGHTDYMHYWIAEALGKTNVKETLDNSTYKNEGCDLLNTGYCQENGVITYELSDKNYNYLINGSPSIGEPPLPTEPDPITPEEIKNDLEEFKKAIEDYIKYSEEVGFNNKEELDKLTNEQRIKATVGFFLHDAKLEIKENGINFIFEDDNIFINYDGFAFVYDWNKDDKKSFKNFIKMAGVEAAIQLYICSKNSLPIPDDSKLDFDNVEYDNYIIGDYTKNGFEIEYKTIKIEEENYSSSQKFMSRFKYSAKGFNLDNVKVTNLDDGKGNNGVIEPDNKDNKEENNGVIEPDNKDNKEENNGVGIENPNTGYFVTIILLLSLGAVSIIILSSKHRKYYKI